MLDFYDYGFGNFSFQLGLDGQAALGSNASGPPSADIFGNGPFLENLERLSNNRNEPSPSVDELVNILENPTIPLSISDVFTLQDIARGLRNNPDLLNEIVGANNFILDYALEAAQTIPPFEDAGSIISSAVDDPYLALDAYNAYVGGFESVQEYRYLTGVNDPIFGYSLETNIDIDVSNFYNNFENSFASSFDFNFSYEPIYTFATDSIFGGGSGGGGSSGGGFYDSLRLYSEDISGDSDEDDG